MKKILVMILTIAMLATAVVAFAESGPQGGRMEGPQQGQMQGGPQQADKAPQQKNDSGSARRAPEKSSEAPEIPTDEQSADAPEEPADMTGEKPADMPADGQQPPQGFDGKGPELGGRMIDFGAMVEKGVISQETCERIKAYMDEHKPDGKLPGAPAEGRQPPEKPEGQLPMDGEKPADAPNLPADEQGRIPDLLNELLDAGIISQAEYDAFSAAITAEYGFEIH